MTPRPPLPKSAELPTDTGSAMREQLRQARGDFEIRAHQAREHLDQANERIKARTGRDLILAILVGLAFGAVLLGLGRDTVTLLVARPPRTPEQALAVAVEHHALCPDTVMQGTHTLRALADDLLDQPLWVFWWD